MKRRRHDDCRFAFLHLMMADPSLSAAAKCAATELLLGFRNSKTGQCNPSFAAIGKSIGRSRRAVITSVNELKTAGWVTVTSSKGGSPTNTDRFEFAFGRIEPVSETTLLPVLSTSLVEDDQPVSSTAEGVSYTSHEPLKNHTTAYAVVVGDTRARALAPVGAALGDSFGDFYRAYPKQIGEDAAKRAFNLAISGGANSADIIAGAVRYAAERSGQEDKYTASPANWLRDGRWKDAPKTLQLPIRRSGKASLAALALRHGGVA